MKNSLTISGVFLVLLFSMDASRADIVLTITGDDSSSVVDWNLSGSVTVNQSIVSENNNDLLFPTLADVRWDHLANVGTGGVISSAVIGGASISGAPTISINGGSNLFAGIGLNNFGFIDDAAGDTFQVLFDGFALHPALSDGDTVTYGGSGSMDLGVAKGTMFVDGTYIGEQLLHGSDTINLVVTSVPEPTGFAGLGLASSIFWLRRRRHCH